MLEKISLGNIFFLDIETVPIQPQYEDLDDDFKKLWDKKAEKIKANDVFQKPEETYSRAGIYAEFGKIICISVGIFSQEKQHPEFRVKSFFGDDEKQILLDFSFLLNNYFNLNNNFLCAHNGKEFDFPYISRRLIVHQMELPEALDNWGKKPWETAHLLDTMQLWRFGDYKSYTSLNLLCKTLDIPTPKDDISGEDIWKVYWKDKDLNRIVKYCEKDVLAIARLVQRYKRLPLVQDEQVKHIETGS